jgi:hypothetical protein
MDNQRTDREGGGSVVEGWKILSRVRLAFIVGVGFPFSAYLFWLGWRHSEWSYALLGAVILLTCGMAIKARLRYARK